MTSFPLADMFDHVSGGIRARYGIDLELGDLVGQLDTVTPHLRPEVAKKALVDKLNGFDAAKAGVNRLVAASEHLQAIWAFTPAGWQDREQELAANLSRDPVAGLVDWLNDWFTAACAVRVDALERLQGMNLAVAPGGRALNDRCITATAGLSQHDWDLSVPMLAAGVAGLTLDGHSSPPPSIRDGLSLLMARLAIQKERWADAEAALGRVKGQDRDAAVQALRARLARLQGNVDEAATHLDMARKADPTALDAAVEAIHGVKSQSREAALDAARGAVDAVVSLWDIDAVLGQLLTEIPGEVWVAIAERAEREEDVALVLSSLDRAEEQAETDDYELRALVAETRARTLRGEKNRRSEAVEALVEAGIHWEWASRFAAARADFEEALGLDAGNPAAMLGLADTLVVLSNTEPAPSMRVQTQQAVDLVEAVRRAGKFTADNAWGYMVAASAYLKLSAIVGVANRDLQWQALLAAARGMAHQPDQVGHWRWLAEAASGLGLSKVSVIAARRTSQLANDDESRLSAAIVLGNAGLFQESLAILGTRAEPFVQALRAYVALQSGQPEEARRLMDATQVDPTWFWARENLISALLLIGDETADREADALLKDARGHIDGYEGLHAATFAALVSGQTEDAERWAGQLEDASNKGADVADAPYFVGAAHLLRGDSEGCTTALLRMGSTMRTPRAVGEWTAINEPQLRSLAARSSVSVPDLALVTAAIAEAGRRLEVVDPVAQLSEAMAGKVDVPGARLAAAMTTALIHFALHQPREALNAAQRAATEAPDDPEAHLLEEWLAGVLAAPAEAPASVGSAEIESSAEISQPDEPFPGRLKLELPPSWFAGHADPVHDHQLFLRYLPEVRARSTAHVPPVSVTTEEALEPSGYRIFVDEQLTSEGKIEPGWLYLSDGIELIPESLRPLIAWDSKTDLHRLPAASVAESDTLSILLTMPPIEVVVRLVGKIAESLALGLVTPARPQVTST